MAAATPGSSNSTRASMGLADGANAAAAVVRHGCADAARPPPSVNVEQNGARGPSLSTRLRGALTENGTERFAALPADTRDTAVLEKAARAVDAWRVKSGGLRTRDEFPEKCTGAARNGFEEENGAAHVTPLETKTLVEEKDDMGATGGKVRTTRLSLALGGAAAALRLRRATAPRRVALVKR